MDPYNAWQNFNEKESNPQILEILSKRSDLVNKYSDALISNDTLTNYMEDIILSVIHLHFNRLFGVDRLFEEKIHFFVLETLKGQKFLRKVKVTDENKENSRQHVASLQNN